MSPAVGRERLWWAGGEVGRSARLESRVRILGGSPGLSGLGFPTWNVGVFDETENSAGGKVFGLLRLVSPHSGPGGPDPALQGLWPAKRPVSEGHPSPGPCGPCPELPAGSEAAEEPKPFLLLPQFPTSVCFINTVYSLHRALTLTPYIMPRATPWDRYCFCFCLQMKKLKLRELKCPPQGHRASRGKAGLDLRPLDSNRMLLCHKSRVIIVSSAMSHGTRPGASTLNRETFVSSTRSGWATVSHKGFSAGQEQALRRE